MTREQFNARRDDLLGRVRQHPSEVVEQYASLAPIFYDHLLTVEYHELGAQLKGLVSIPLQWEITMAMAWFPVS